MRPHDDEGKFLRVQDVKEPSDGMEPDLRG